MPGPDAPAREDSLRGLVQQLSEEAGQLVRDEVALAKAEVWETVRQAIWLLVGIGVAVIGILYLIVFGLGIVVEWLPNHTLVTGVIAAASLLVIAVGAGIILAHRRIRLLARTRASLREDIEWARAQSKRGRR
ncbi:MAG TPA: phage holin family protein [Candidatus Dormibacteraeota bacterium]|nr:phage holin family protein [Candidatus Dormibacteraeota bacterium]